jgi:hypothetical protein
MRSHTSHLEDRPARSDKPIPGWAVVALLAVALAILLSAFFAFSPLFSDSAIGNEIVPAEID